LSHLHPEHRVGQSSITLPSTSIASSFLLMAFAFTYSPVSWTGASYGSGSDCRGMGSNTIDALADISDASRLLRSIQRQFDFGLSGLRENHSLRRFRECIAEISHRMPRHSTAPPALDAFAAFRFDRRCAKGHREFAAAWGEGPLLTVAFNPVAVVPHSRFALSCQVPITSPHPDDLSFYRCGGRREKHPSILTTTGVS